MAVKTDILVVVLVVMVCATWLGCLGFARLRTPLDRIHCVAFVNVAAGVALTIAAFVADGPSTRAFKILLATVVTMGSGAALSHATGRALWYRSATSTDAS